MTPKLRRSLLCLAILFVLAIAQAVVVPLISIANVIPSLLLIGTVFVTLREGQMTGMLVSFPAGLLVDAYSSALVGITPLGLTVAAFAAGFSFDEEKAPKVLRSPRAVMIVFFTAILYHLVAVFSYFQSLEIDLLWMMASHVLGATVYTTILSTIPVLLLARRVSRLKI